MMHKSEQLSKGQKTHKNPIHERVEVFWGIKFHIFTQPLKSESNLNPTSNTVLNSYWNPRSTETLGPGTNCRGARR